MRVMVVWCPDWSVVAALDEADRSLRSPAAVLSANVVEVCNGPARAEGVRRGQRRRDAQARCPELVLLPANPDRDARAFEPVLAIVEDLRPGVAALRPGLLAVRAPGSWYGTETAAAATVCQALVESGVWDVPVRHRRRPLHRRAGRPHRRGAVVDGRAARRVRRLPARAARAGAPGRRPARARAGRPAAAARPAHPRRPRRPAGRRRRAPARQPTAPPSGDVPAARTATLFAARTPPPELDAEVAFEPPLDSVEAITFSVRTTAERFVSQLAHHQLVATGVRVEAESDGVVCSSRTWLHPRHFTARDLVDRVHWQLQSAGSTSGLGGSLRARKESGEVRAPIDRVRFVPEVVEPAAAHGEALWGVGLRRPRRARRGPGAGHGRLRRRTPSGAAGRSQPGRAAVPRAVGRARGRPAPARPAVAGPGARAGPGAGLRHSPGGRGRRRRRARGVGHRPRRRQRRAAALPGRRCHRRQSLPWQPVTAWAGPWPTDEGWWSGGAGPTCALPGRRRRRPGLAAAARARGLVAGGRL